MCHTMDIVLVYCVGFAFIFCSHGASIEPEDRVKRKAYEKYWSNSQKMAQNNAAPTVLKPNRMDMIGDEMQDSEKGNEWLGVLMNCGLYTRGPLPPYHTACRQPSSYLLQELKPNQAERKQIVLLHNLIRSTVMPPAANMLRMSYSKQLTLLAQRWASTCPYGHDVDSNRNVPGKYKVSQNMHMTENTVPTWPTAISLWDQLRYANYSKMIAAISSKVGCGGAKCRDPNDRNAYRLVSVCNYAPANDVIPGALPYKVNKDFTSSCSDCKSNCNDNLCDCFDDKLRQKQTDICYDTGLLDVNKCSCDCTRSIYSGYKCNECGDKNRRYCQQTMDLGLCGTWPLSKHCCKTCSMHFSNGDRK